MMLVGAALGVPKVFDLITDPKEEYPATGIRNTWNAAPAMKIVVEYEQSVEKHPPIAPGTRILSAVRCGHTSVSA